MLSTALRATASALQNPVIALLLILAIVVVVMLGMLIAEWFTERRQFTMILPKLIDELDSDKPAEEVIAESGLINRQRKALAELLQHPAASPQSLESLAVNQVAEEKSRMTNRTKVTDYIAKVAPMLGLMGTLIPLGPGLIAIGDGETAILSESLLTAFDTTVMGLLIAAVALLISTVRKAWYAKYLAAFEAASECVLEKAIASSSKED